jgi:hypothetical protein
MKENYMKLTFHKLKKGDILQNKFIYHDKRYEVVDIDINAPMATIRNRDTGKKVDVYSLNNYELVESTLLIPMMESLLEYYEVPSSDYETKITNRRNDMLQFLKGKKLGGLELFNLKSLPFYSSLTFSIKADGLQVDFFIRFETLSDKPVARVDISSPNKPGTFHMSASGRNSENEGVWKLINNIYMGKYKRK